MKPTHFSPSRRAATHAFSMVALAVGLAACNGGSDPEQPPVPPPPPPTAMTCEQLKSLIIPASAIGLPTGGASIESTEKVAASGSGASSLGSYCKLIGAISPVDPNAPKIRFQVNLPDNWNNKSMMFGGGGYNGVLGSFINVVHGGPTDQLTPLGRGYVVYGSDSGHTLKPPFIFGRDGSFATNAEALNNFAGDALKKTHDAARFVINARYLLPVKKTYFLGGSTGGREALAVVQRWPSDFDGVVSFFPAWNSAAMTLQFGRVARAMAQPGAYPNVAKRILLQNAAMAKCDALDGVADGIVSNVSACNAAFDPSNATVDGSVGGTPLRCPGGVDTGDTCLSDAQITALKVMDTPAKFNFGLASGETQYPGVNVWGSDLGIPYNKPELALNQILGLNALAPVHPITPDMPYGAIFYDQWTKYFVTGDANFNGLTLDPENPGNYASRISALSSLQDVNKTDLSAFLARGGKLLIAHGLADVLVSSRATANYVDRVRTSMTRANADKFLRYYEVPGYGHSVSNQFNLGWDSVTALENWVERDVAPVNQVAIDKTGVPGRSRPLCEYGTWPKYKGSGDVNLAVNYSCSS